MKYQVAFVLFIALVASSLAAEEQKPVEGRNKRGVFPYAYAATYPYATPVAAPYAAYPYAYAPAAYSAPFGYSAYSSPIVAAPFAKAIAAPYPFAYL